MKNRQYVDKPAEQPRSLTSLHSHFVSKQQANGFQALLSPIHVITQKQVVGFRWEAPVLKQAQKIGVLAVDIACNQALGDSGWLVEDQLAGQVRHALLTTYFDRSL